MTILITGVTGQVGGALVRNCERLDRVVAAGRAVLDMSKPDDLAASLDEIRPTLIINPAAYTAVDKAEEDGELAMCVNAIAPGILARWAADHDVPMIHFSTDYVFNGEGHTPYREADPTHPLSVYGKTKRQGEINVAAAGGPSLIVRTSWVYAAHGTNFLNTIARLALERDELSIVADQFGAPTPATLIGLAVGDMLSGGQASFRDRCRRADGMVHLTAAGVTSWYGFAIKIVEGMRERGLNVKARVLHPIATADYPTPARRPQNSRLDLQRLGTVFGIEPPSWDALVAVEMAGIMAHTPQAHPTFRLTGGV